MKTAKFGGTSLADAARFRQVKRIVSADPELRFVVVSAPGKRSAEDKKVTDLLYDCHGRFSTRRSCTSLTLTASRSTSWRSRR